MPIVPENKAGFICILCVSLFLFFNNKHKIIKNIFIFAHFGLNIHHSFYICYLERPCLYNREIILVALIRQNSKTNMTKNHDEIVIFKKTRDIIFLPYRPPLLLKQHVLRAASYT